MKKISYCIIFLLIFSPAYSFAKADKTCYDIVISSEQTTCIDKNILSNVLSLTDKQIEENKAFLESDDCSELYLRLEKEQARLESMENRPFVEISKQKIKINKIKHQITKHIQKNDKAFRKTLTRPQRSKYSMIKKLQRLELNKQEFDYYKNNPQMQPFGNP